MNELGNYRLVEKIGQGGMGAVYLGIHKDNGSEAAIKVIRSDLSSASSLVKRFKHEIEVTKQFSHPYVVKVYDGGYLEGPKLLYLAMEYLEGRSLKEYSEEGRLSSDSACRIMLHLSEALSYIHERGIIHRDIKPDNIHVVSEDRTVLLDFGLALVDNQTRLSATSDRPGTWLTMSPEQLAGKELDKSSDIYSLGITMYWALTGEAPYGTKEIYKMGAGILPEPVENICKHNGAVSTKLAMVIHKCIAYVPDHRFKSAEKLHKHLKSGPTEMDYTLSSASSRDKRPESDSSAIKRSQLMEPLSTDSNGLLKLSETSGKLERFSAGSSASPREDRRAYRKRLVIAVLILILFAGLILSMKFFAGDQGRIVFSSRIVGKTAFSVEIEIRTPLSDLSHLSIVKGDGELLKSVKFDENVIPESGNIIVNGLPPNRTLGYVLHDRNQEKSLLNKFSTCPLLQNLTPKHVKQTVVSVEFEPLFSGEGLLKASIYESVNESRMKTPWISVEKKDAFTVHERKEMKFPGLKPDTDYVLSLSLDASESIDGVEWEKELYFKTKKIAPSVVCYIGKGNRKRTNFNDILSGKDNNWGKAIDASSVRVKKGKIFAFSGDGAGLYLFHIQKKKIINSLPLKARNNIILRGRGKNLYCLDVPSNSIRPEPSDKVYLTSYEYDSLKKVRSIQLPYDCYRFFLEVYNDVCVVALSSGNSQLRACSMKSGKALWTSEYTVRTAFSTLDSKGYLWVMASLSAPEGSDENKLSRGLYSLYCIDIKTGSIQCKVPLGGALSCSPVEVGDNLIACLETGELFVVDRITGRPRTSIYRKNPVMCTAVKGNTVFFIGAAPDMTNVMGTGGEKGKAFALWFKPDGTATEIYSVEIPHARNVQGEMLLANGRLYFETPMVGINCIDAATGRYLYTTKAVKIANFHFFPAPGGMYFSQISSAMTLQNIGATLKIVRDH